MENSHEMENLLAGYSDTLQFILQFLHTEGFQEAENVLMQEIEKRLPVLLEEKIAAGSLASSGVSNATTEPEVGEDEWAARPAAEGLEQLQRGNVQSVSEGQSGDLEEDCSADPFAELDSSLSQVDIGATVDNHPQSPTASNPELRKTFSMPGDSPGGSRATKRSLSLPIMGRDSGADEYSDDEDTGYVRVEIEDQEAFLSNEIETQEELARGSDASSEEGGGGAAGTSQSRESQDNGLHSDDSSRSSSGSSSCKSSYFSGEVSEEVPGSVSRISDFGSPNREGFWNNVGADNASLPPADADEEVVVMGLDPAGTAPASVADGIDAPEAAADAAHSTSESTCVASVLDSQSSLLDLAAPSMTVSTEQVPDEVSSPVAVEGAAGSRTGGVEPASPPTQEGEGAAAGGLDFAFPVTPTAEDPSVVFSTWTHLRSRSLSNASDLSGFSPSQQSPERGNLLDSMSGKSTAQTAPGSAVSNAGGDLGKGPCIEHGSGTSLGQQQDVSFPPLAPAENSSQAAWRPGPEESEKQALFVLEALEHAQNISGQVPKERFGSSHGSHMSAGSPEAPSPLNSGTEIVALWNDEEAQDKESDGSSEPEAEFSIPYSSDEFVPAADSEKDDDEDVARDTPTAEFASQEEQPEKDVAEKAEDLEVMQYDPEKLARKYEIFNLQIVHRRNHTGFEETKDFPIRLNDCVAGRYQILDFLGSAAFSRAVQALDLKTGLLVCLKIIKNNKDYFDQSLDEIKLLKYVNSADPMDTAGILQMYDYFYYKEHLFIVCELLRANLYEFQKYNRDSGDEPYFILPRLQTIAQQVLKSLAFLHGLGLIHSDLKPENILIKSYSRCEVKVIDLGSSCFTTDHLSNYVQSRSYRAPEVILGQTYDQRIDIWSLGCILAELASGFVLFQNDSLATLIARLIGILGPFPKDMLKSGRYVHRFLTRSGHPYERSPVSGNYQLLRPKKTSLSARVPQGDPEFIDFLRYLFTLDPAARPTAAEALEHPWLKKAYPPVTEAGS